MFLRVFSLEHGNHGKEKKKKKGQVRKQLASGTTIFVWDDI